MRRNFRTRTGLAVRTNVLRRALVARFLPLDFVQTATPILILPPSGSTMVANPTSSTHAVTSRQAVSGGGDFGGRLEKSAWSRSA
jgi:hypothetical protein